MFKTKTFRTYFVQKMKWGRRGGCSPVATPPVTAIVKMLEYHKKHEVDERNIFEFTEERRY